MDCDVFTSELCGDCTGKATDGCPAEKVILNRILGKLDENEQLFLAWMVAKARGAGNFSIDEFAEALTKVMASEERR